MGVSVFFLFCPGVGEREEASKDVARGVGSLIQNIGRGGVSQEEVWDGGGMEVGQNLIFGANIHTKILQWGKFFTSSWSFFTYS